MAKKAIIIGVNGQDGKILFDFLVKKNYALIGLDKNNIRVYNYKWSAKVDITSTQSVINLVKKIKPDEIYHLAAIHHSAEEKSLDSSDYIHQSYQINVYSLINFLEAIKTYSPRTKLFYAASSLIFGDAPKILQTENSPLNPNSIYGIDKATGLFLCRLYRQEYGIFAAVGILFNHESAQRSEKFISRKIIQGAIDIKNKKAKELVVGNLQAQADWGYAPDFIEAMHKILQTKMAADFIVATGQPHRVLDFVKIAFGSLDLDW